MKKRLLLVFAIIILLSSLVYALSLNDFLTELRSKATITGSAVEGCADSDGGKDFYIKGTVDVNNKSYTDYCGNEIGLAFQEGDRIFEYFCTTLGGSPIQGQAQDICLYGCSNGACNTPQVVCGDGFCDPLTENASVCPSDCELLDIPANKSCIDSDNGEDYFTKGYALSDINGIDYDRCQDTLWLQEAVCNTNGWSAHVVYRCEKGCTNGVCISTEGNCTAGYKCYNADTLGYQNSLCEWGRLQNCENGCTNGACLLNQTQPINYTNITQPINYTNITQPINITLPINITQPINDTNITQPINITEPSNITEPINETPEEHITEPIENVTLELLAYEFSNFIERIDLFFTPNEIKKARKYINYAENDLKKAQRLAEEEKSPELINRLINDYEENINIANQLINTVSQEGEDITEIKQAISSSTRNNIEVLKEVYEKIPEQARPAIENAIISSTKNIEKKETDDYEKESVLELEDKEDENDEEQEDSDEIKESEEKTETRESIETAPTTEVSSTESETTSESAAETSTTDSSKGESTSASSSSGDGGRGESSSRGDSSGDGGRGSSSSDGGRGSSSSSQGRGKGVTGNIILDLIIKLFT